MSAIDLYWAASLGKWVTIPYGPAGNGKRIYGDWIIYRDPPPIPDRGHDWRFYHVDYDGAPDGGDGRCGTARNLFDALTQIDEIRADQGVTTIGPMDDCRTTNAAGRIMDVFMGGDTTWRTRLDASRILESADWERAVQLARAALGREAT